MNRFNVTLIGAILCACAATYLLVDRSDREPSHRAFPIRNRTRLDAATTYAASARERMHPAFRRRHVAYPPAKIAILALKAERLLEVWAVDDYGWHLIKRYPIFAASGVAGPKLREGDRQVPEGIYRIALMNPNSSYHLSMQIDYPNEFDLDHAREEGRTHPGGEIFIHGDSVSIGCIAIGDEAIEELYVLVSDVTSDDVAVVIAPHDPRKRPLSRSMPNAPSWLPELYAAIEKAFKPFEASAERPPGFSYP